MAAPIADADGVLATPERNNYFYGLLMDVARFKKEESYFNQKRWLLNRLVLGTGVVCGLDVTTDAASQTKGTVFINPGVAIDGLGREIIVPSQIPVNALKLTDDQGNPGGDAKPGTVVICLAYVETLVDPIPVLVPDCDHPGNCACSTVREQFQVVVRQAAGANANAAPPPFCTLGQLPLPVDGVLQNILSKKISATSPGPPLDARIPLARVTISDGPAIDKIDPSAGRLLVYDNPLLYELILCLSNSVNQLRILRYVSGDAQIAKQGPQLANPLVVEVVDWTGKPMNDPAVSFTPSAGTVTPPNVNGGTVSASWTLGASPGVQEVIAKAKGSPFIVKFNATAT